MRIDHRGDLTAVKRETIRKINEQAGVLRSRYVTTIPGQEMIYLEKKNEAENLMLDPDLPNHETPHITAEARQEGISRFDKAVEILSVRQLWLTVSSIIEAKRLAAKQAIEAATTIKDVIKAGEIDWQLDTRE